MATKAIEAVGVTMVAMIVTVTVTLAVEVKATEKVNTQ